MVKRFVMMKELLQRSRKYQAIACLNSLIFMILVRKTKTIHLWKNHGLSGKFCDEGSAKNEDEICTTSSSV
jgi:hypothetical protein